jgi:hypothetical protein
MKERFFGRMMNKDSVAHPFNNEIEYGLRALIILQNIFPNRCDLDILACLDYLVVHSGDFNPDLKSVHAPLPGRKEEIFIRRNLLEKGLNLLMNYCLVKPIYLPEGVYYQISDEGEPFLDSLNENYTYFVKKRAMWAVKEFGGSEVELIRAKIKNSLDSIDSEIAFHMDFSWRE